MVELWHHRAWQPEPGATFYRMHSTCLRLRGLCSDSVAGSLCRSELLCSTRLWLLLNSNRFRSSIAHKDNKQGGTTPPAYLILYTRTQLLLVSNKLDNIILKLRYASKNNRECLPARPCALLCCVSSLNFNTIVFVWWFFI